MNELCRESLRMVMYESLYKSGFRDHDRYARNFVAITKIIFKENDKKEIENIIREVMLELIKNGKRKEYFLDDIKEFAEIGFVGYGARELTDDYYKYYDKIVDYYEKILSSI